MITVNSHILIYYTKVIYAYIHLISFIYLLYFKVKSHKKKKYHEIQLLTYIKYHEIG